MRALLPLLPLLAAGCAATPYDDLPPAAAHAILAERVESGYAAVPTEAVLGALDGLAAGERDAVPLVAELILDPLPEVQVRALRTLERLRAREALPRIAEAALLVSQEDTLELAYDVFSELSGTRVRALDEKALADVLAREAPPPAGG